MQPLCLLKMNLEKGINGKEIQKYREMGNISNVGCHQLPKREELIISHENSRYFFVGRYIFFSQCALSFL